MNTKYKLGDRVLVLREGIETLRTITDCTVELTTEMGIRTYYNGGEFDDNQIMGTVTVTPPKVKRTRRKRRTTSQQTLEEDLHTSPNELKIANLNGAK